jgi:hypothetical protein
MILIIISAQSMNHFQKCEILYEICHIFSWLAKKLVILWALMTLILPPAIICQNQCKLAKVR